MSADHLSYQDFVTALAKPGGNIIAGLVPVSAELWHMATGLVTEMPELRAAAQGYVRKDLVEEVGDARFYLNGILVLFGVSEEDILSTLWETQRMDMVEAMPDAVRVPHTGSEVRNCMDISCMLLDQVKRICVYEQDPNSRSNEVLYLCSQILRSLRRICENTMIGWKEIELANREKLSERYNKLQFSNEAATERADKAAGE